MLNRAWDGGRSDCLAVDIKLVLAARVADERGTLGDAGFQERGATGHRHPAGGGVHRANELSVGFDEERNGRGWPSTMFWRAPPTLVGWIVASIRERLKGIEVLVMRQIDQAAVDRDTCVAREHLRVRAFQNRDAVHGSVEQTLSVALELEQGSRCRHRRSRKKDRSIASQALRIPRDLELPGRAATLRKEGPRLIVEPVAAPSLLAVLAKLRPIDEEFPPIARPAAEPVEI